MNDIKKIQELFLKSLKEAPRQSSQATRDSHLRTEKPERFLILDPNGNLLSSGFGKLKTEASIRSLLDKLRRHPDAWFINGFKNTSLAIYDTKTKEVIEVFYQDLNKSWGFASNIESLIDKQHAYMFSVKPKNLEITEKSNNQNEIMNDIKKIQEFFSKSLDEAKEETAVDMAKRQLDALGVKYELGNKFKPFKTIYKPTGKSDKFYDTFEDIVDLFSLKSVVKSSMSEANGFKSGKEFINIKLQKYPKAVAKINQLISMVGESNFTMEMAEWLFDFFNNASYESPVTEGVKKEIDEAELTEAYVPSNIKEFAKRKGVSSLVNKVAGWAEKVGKGIRGGTAIGKDYSTLVLDMDYQTGDIRINTDDNTITLYDEPADSFDEFKQVYLDNQDIEEINEAKGSLKVEKQKDGKYYWTFTFESGKTEKSFDGFNTSAEAQKDFMYRSKFLKETTIKENVAPNHDGKAAPYGSGYKPLEERILEAFEKINEELCPAGKAYRKRRMAAGEKSSAYLSGRAVKVCKGQMSGKKKKK